MPKSSGKYTGTELNGKYNGTEVETSNSADDSYQGDSDEGVELVETYEAAPSRGDTASTEDVVVPEDTVDGTSSYELIETYEPASSPPDDAASSPAPSTAKAETVSPASATQSPEPQPSSSSSSLIFLTFTIIVIAALYATHHFRPDLTADLRERLSSVLFKLAAYLHPSEGRARQRDTEEGDELESKGLMGQYNKQPGTLEKEAEAEDGDREGSEGYQEGRASRRS